MKEDLEAVERFIAEELETRRSSYEPVSSEAEAQDIADAESALAALRRVRVRVERIRQWAESHADDSDPPEMSSRAEAELMLVFLNDPES